MAQKKLLLIDGNSVAFRAFYALYRQLDRFTSPDGLHTNAIFTFKNMLDAIMKQTNPTDVLDGNLDDFINAYLKWYKNNK